MLLLRVCAAITAIAARLDESAQDKAASPVLASECVVRARVAMRRPFRRYSRFERRAAERAPL